jgi:hypothetical protein
VSVRPSPTGGLFGLWQSGGHTGVDLYNEPGSLTWNEAMVGDYQAGMDFYAAGVGGAVADHLRPPGRPHGHQLGAGVD